MPLNLPRIWQIRVRGLDSIVTTEHMPLPSKRSTVAILSKGEEGTGSREACAGVACFLAEDLCLEPPVVFLTIV